MAAREKTSPQHIADLLATAMGGAARPAFARKAKQYALWEQWEQIVGAQLAATARPLRMQDTTLVIAAPNHAWVQQLTFMGPEILQKVQQYLEDGLVTGVRFVVARAADGADR